MLKTSKFLYGGHFFPIIILLIISDATIILDVPILRQIFGFIFLTILPGLLIVQILKLENIDSLDSFILIWGLSISFLLLFGLLVNNVALSIGYETPLSTFPLLISFNIMYIVLAIIGYIQNNKLFIPLFNLNLSILEKSLLVIPVLFPALSILGIHLMNVNGNNKIIIFTVFLVLVYITFICCLNDKFPKRLYPIVIYLIGISVLFLYSFRSSHIIGVDVHTEYYFFLTTLSNMYWSTFGHSTLDSTLSISLLPTIYHSILNTDTEFLFKTLYSLLYSIFPLVAYIVSKKYIGENYSFIAIIFIMSQKFFLLVPVNPRTDIALLFVALAIMVLFNDFIDAITKRILFLIFLASMVVSHYSTTYIFFLIMVGTYIGTWILSHKYVIKKVISLRIILILFSLIFVWYSLISEVAFSSGVKFLINTFSTLNEMFMLESRGGGIPAVLGSEIEQKAIPHKIEFVFTWLTFAFIGVGIFTLIKDYKQMVLIKLNSRKPDFLTAKLEVEYSLIALICIGLLFVTVALPHISIGYGIDRLYGVTNIILSTFFVIGGIILSRSLNFKPWLIMLIVIAPYFLCITGVMYNSFDVPREIILNSEGGAYHTYYVHDQESYSAKWLMNFNKQYTTYADFYGGKRLISQGPISPSQINYEWLETNSSYLNGYIYMSYSNVYSGELVDYTNKRYNLTDYEHIISKKNNIYDGLGSKIYL